MNYDIARLTIELTDFARDSDPYDFQDSYDNYVDAWEDTVKALMEDPVAIFTSLEMFIQDYEDEEVEEGSDLAELIETAENLSEKVWVYIETKKKERI